MSFAPRALGIFAVVAALSTTSAPASADPSAADKETARSLMDQGDDRMEAKDYPAAIKAYQAADAIMHLPQTGIAVARAQLAAKLLVEALDTATLVKQLPVKPGELPAAAKARAEAAALVDKVAKRLASIVVKIDGAPAGVVVAIDGDVMPPAAATAPRKVNPGQHVITVKASGFADARAEVTVAEGATITVPLSLVRAPEKPAVVGADPATSAPARAVSPLVPAGFAVGGAGLIIGAITGGLTLSKASSLKAACTGGVCGPSQHDALGSANTLANVSNVSIGIGAAGVAVGVVGLVLTFRSPAPAAPTTAGRVVPLIGPGTIGVAGTF